MKIDKFEPSPAELVDAIFELAAIQQGEKYLELGSGDGQCLARAGQYTNRAAGWEIDEDLVAQTAQDYDVTQGDCMEADVSRADVVMFNFSRLPQTKELMNKLQREMKLGARLIAVMHHVWPDDWRPKKVIRTSPNFWTISLYIKESSNSTDDVIYDDSKVVEELAH